MLKKHHVMAALAAGSTIVLANSASAVTSTFDSDLEGWTAVGIDVDFGNLLSPLSFTDNSADAVHDAGAGVFTGNAGGFARFTDAVEDPGSFLRAPGSFTGDLSSFAGGTFSYDHRLRENGLNATSVQDYVIAFISGGLNTFEAYVAVISGPTLADADTGWVNVSVVLDESNFTPVDDLDLGIFDPSLAGSTASGLSFGVIDTSSSFEQVLGNVTDVLISFELVDNNSTQNSESGGVDNVTLVPEPSSLALLGLGGLIAVRRRRG